MMMVNSRVLFIIIIVMRHRDHIVLITRSHGFMSISLCWDHTVRRYLSSMSLQPPPSLVGCTGGTSLISSLHVTVLPGFISSGLETTFSITVVRRVCLSAWNAACCHTDIIPRGNHYETLDKMHATRCITLNSTQCRLPSNHHEITQWQSNWTKQVRNQQHNYWKSEQAAQLVGYDLF